MTVLIHKNLDSDVESCCNWMSRKITDERIKISEKNEEVIAHDLENCAMRLHYCPNCGERVRIFKETL